MNKKWIRRWLIPIGFIALAASILWTYTSVKTSQTQTPAGKMTVEVIPDYSITSGKDLLAWPKGTVFDQGMAAYFYAAQPFVKVTPVIQATGMEQGKLEGSIHSRVILQALNDKSEVYWTYQLQQLPPQQFTLENTSPGDNGQLSYKASDILLNVPAAYDLVVQIGKELLFQTGDFELVVISDVFLQGSVNGLPVDKNINQQLPVTLQQVSFSLPKSQDATTFSDLAENSLTSGRKPFYDTLRSSPIPFASDILLVILLLVLLVRFSPAGSKEEREQRRYKEWITEGRVEVKDRFSIHILSLEGLVDLAIDLDKRVIHDSKLHRYYVLTEDIVYIYDPESMKALAENKTQLGKLLLERGLIQAEQLEIGLYYQKKIGTRLGESLIALGFIDEAALYSTLADQQNIDYYELNPMMEINSGWLDKIGIQKARALMSLPLGLNMEGKLVVVCSETAREGMKQTLQEMFHTQITLMAARPSVVHKLLDRMEEHERVVNNHVGSEDQDLAMHLTKEEKDQFHAAYQQGLVKSDLFLKAAGRAILERNDTGNLLKGLIKAVEELDIKIRREKQVPELLELLTKAHYLTQETAEWIRQEQSRQGISLKLLLRTNYLASEDTITSAEHLLETLAGLLKQ